MSDPFFREPVVLTEVRDAFNDMGAAKKEEERTEVRTEVIVGVKRGHKIEKVLRKLEELRVEGAKATDFYVMANVTEAQVNELAKEESVFKIWLNKKMEPMVDVSAATIKSSPALQLFGADGDGISWAVLDTGIKEDHDFFKKGPPIVKAFNFTTEPPEDKVGHGTHVAGIIRKLAPMTKIYDFKVLGHGGSTSFAIMQAMYEIRKMNLAAPQLVIHGANMSLGGPVPVGSYGCGFSPECQEANRLVESGVVVCVAASNDGYKTVATIGDGNELEYFPTFLDMGISDPGNAEKVITVGSCHKTHPHKYGISWFSSKGPTGDGRFKPDVVAPGEQIESAGIASNVQKVKKSGTSMATPHVSGAIAQFLSLKKELIGCPGEVKEILMKTCTDLKRDKYFQGAGLIDVLRMCQAV